MTRNIFREHPEFIDTDPRNQRPEWLAYRVDPDFMHLRHEILLPEHSLKGKTVLDLGSCNAASGDWALSLGAASYVGVEMQEEYVTQSKKNLELYYPADRWTIIQDSVESFLSKSQEKFDVIIALGVVHAFNNTVAFLNALAARAQYITIDGTHPYTVNRSVNLSPEFRSQFLSTADYVRFIENEPFVAMHQTGMSLHSKQTVIYDGFVPSMGFVTQILKKTGFASVPGINDELKRLLPNVYNPSKKFGLSFVKNKESRGAALGLAQNFSRSGKLPSVKWTK